MADIAEQSVNISFIYSFLAQGMRYPNDQRLHGEYFSQLISILEDLGGEIEAETVRQLTYPSNSDNLIEQLQIEYTRLFITHYPHTVAPPYGSIYMDYTLQSKFTEETASFYKTKNFLLVDNTIPPDHLVTELEFLALLSSKQDSDGENRFLEDLFRPWFKRFQQQITSVSCHPYYRIMIQLIDFFTLKDEDYGIHTQQT